MTLLPLALHALDPAGEIARQGDIVWDNLLLLYKRDTSWLELKPAAAFSPAMTGKIITLPVIDLNNRVTDRNQNPYYYHSDENRPLLFIFPQNPAIQPQLDVLNSVLEPSDDRFQVMGRIVEVISVETPEQSPGSGEVWDGREVVVALDIIALRIENKVCVVVERENAALVGQAHFDTLVDEQIMLWTFSVPENVTTVPAGLDPEAVAKWFLFFGSIRKNSQIWNQLCSVDKNIVSSSGLLRAPGQNWWHTVSDAARIYFFTGADSAKKTAASQVFFYGIRENGQTIATAKSLTVTLEKSGQWRVSSF
jgi:hypothetical protein